MTNGNQRGGSTRQRARRRFGNKKAGQVCKPCAVKQRMRRRKAMAQAALAHTKNVFPNGAGNQIKKIRSSGGNTNIRTAVARDKQGKYQVTNARVKQIARQNANALAAHRAARAKMTGGGNCDEFGAVAYDFLRTTFPKEKFTLVGGDGHVFVIIGDMQKDPPSQWVVVDGWVNEPEVVTFDHFFYTFSKVKARSRGDTRDYGTEMRRAGLGLNEKGKARLKDRMTRKKMEAMLERDSKRPKDERIFWNNDSPRRSDYAQ